MIRERYGASPLHLLAHLGALALTAWALLQILDLSTWGRILLWLAGAIVLHDFVLLPFYSVLDRMARRGLGRAAINYVRVPALLSGLLALVFFPLICGRSNPVLEGVSGVAPEGYLERWLLACAVLFAASGLLFAVRRVRGRGSREPEPVPAP